MAAATVSSSLNALKAKIPFLRAVERTLAQVGPYYYDPHWNDDGGNGDGWSPPGLCSNSVAERAWPPRGC